MIFAFVSVMRTIYSAVVVPLLLPPASGAGEKIKLDGYAESRSDPAEGPSVLIVDGQRVVESNRIKVELETTFEDTSSIKAPETDPTGSERLSR